VWQEFADPAVWASWMGRYDKTELIEGASLQAGGKVRMHWTERASSREREYGGRTQEREATWEVPEVVPGRLIVMGQRPNFQTWRLEAMAGGTRVTRESELKSFAATLFRPVAKLFEGAQGDIDFRQLKKKCEQA
jgi:hypothetical protein